MNAICLKGAIAAVSESMDKNRDYLVELDSQNGDGDLGISMASGFKAVSEYLDQAEETNLGKLMMKAGGIFNEKAPSTLGTIISFGMIGMAKSLKGKEETSLAELADAMQAGLDMIMDKAKSKPGEKTILDSLCPGVAALRENAAAGDGRAAFQAAKKAAAEGSERTKNMLSVHGRAAYYGDKSLGVLDGGSVVGKLIFEAVSGYLAGKAG